MGQFELNGRLLMGPWAPSPACCAEGIWQKLVVLRKRAGEGARGPSKSGYQRPNLEFKIDTLANTHGPERSSHALASETH
jgi:hypothetical protein